MDTAPAEHGTSTTGLTKVRRLPPEVSILGVLIGIALVLSPKLNLAGTGVNAETLAASFASVLGIAAGTIWQKRFVTNADLRTSTSLQYLGRCS